MSSSIKDSINIISAAIAFIGLVLLLIISLNKDLKEDLKEDLNELREQQQTVAKQRAIYGRPDCEFYWEEGPVQKKYLTCDVVVNIGQLPHKITIWDIVPSEITGL